MVEYHGTPANFDEEAKTARDHVHGVCTDTHGHPDALGDGTSFTLPTRKALLYFSCTHLAVMSSVCCGHCSTRAVPTRHGCGETGVGKCATVTERQQIG